MAPSRRSVLKGSIIGSIGIAGCLQYIPCLDDVACFNFRHYPADDAPDKLEITHTGGDNLPANEVYITNIALDYSARKNGTVAWSELDNKGNPSSGIGGETVRVDILLLNPGTVQVLWRHDDQEQIIGETQDL